MDHEPSSLPAPKLLLTWRRNDVCLQAGVALGVPLAVIGSTTVQEQTREHTQFF
jgi:hypothetical protein